MSEIHWSLLQKYKWLRAFQIWMMGPKMWSARNKMEVLFNFCFINFLPSHTVEAAEPLQPHFPPPTPGLGSRLSLGGWNLTKLIIGKVHYKFCFKNLPENDWPQLQKYMGPRPFQIQILGRKMCYASTKSWMLYNFCFANFLPSYMLEAAEPPWPHFGPPGPGLRFSSKARRLRTDQVDYWEGALQLLCHKLCLKMIDHGTRSAWGSGPSRSRLGIQKCDLTPLKQGHTTTFVL